MALQLIKKTSAPRANAGVPRELDYNDIVFRTGELRGEAKDEFSIAPDLLESTGLKDADKGGALLFDDETKTFYLAVVPKDAAEIFKPREKKNKTRNFQHKDALEIMVKEGLIPADRTIGFVTAFKLTDAPEIKEAVEGAFAAYKLSPDQVVSRLLPKEEKAATATTETTAPAIAEVTAPVEAPAEPESVAATEEGWDE